MGLVTSLHIPHTYINEIISVYWLKNWLSQLAFNSFHHYLSYQKLLSFSSYFPYIWDVIKVIYKVSVPVIAAGNIFLRVGTKLLATELHILIFSETYLF